MDRRTFLRSAGALGASAFITTHAPTRAWLLPRPLPPSRGKATDDRPGPATTAFMDGLWDEQLGQIRFPFEEQPPPVRETVWYAIGLLQRDAPGDRGRARRALETVVAKQYDSPGTTFHGSYPRYAGEPPLPPPDAVPFVQFDPNWRQFIGTAFALAGARFGEQLGSLRDTLDTSTEVAAAGEDPGRVEADYSNIAIMQAWLLAHTGSRRQGEQLARQIAQRYRDAGALDEYNSPTYDGVSLYGLALWRDESPSPVFASLGDELYAGLWGNISRSYHPRLRNVCGPYARAVGMDLDVYASVVGLWIWSVVGRDAAPFPNLAQPFEHAGDVCWGPLVELLATDVPRAARSNLRRLGEERRVRAGVPGTWEATSWLGRTVMLGGHTGMPVRVGAQQRHPATIHWPEGWIRIVGGTPIDAVASERRLEIAVAPPGPATATIGLPGLDPAVVGPDHWELPGLRVEVTAGAAPIAGPTVVPEGIALDFPPTTLTLVVSSA